MSRGIRNFNPGNIKDFGIPWNGMMAYDDRDTAQKQESTFVVFRAPWWGIRATAIIIRNYQRRHGLKTIAEIINRWAPASDNNPVSDYAAFVAARVGTPSNYEIDAEDFSTMRAIVQAIVSFENGLDPYTWEYNTGLILAGIEPPAEAA